MHTTRPEPGHLRSCLSRFVTGVAVVSYLADGEPRGVTVNSFTSVSMDPPLILVSLARTAAQAVLEGGRHRVPAAARAERQDGEPARRRRGGLPQAR